MSLNKHTSEGLVLLQTEAVILEAKGVEAEFKNFSHSSELMKGTKQGNIHLTNYRVIFVNSRRNAPLNDFNMPFRLIKNFDIKQPLFGPNALKGKIIAEEGGGWEGSADFELKFTKGGAIEIGKKIVELAKNPPQPVAMAIIIQGQNVQAPPPPYDFRINSDSSSTPSEAPPEYKR